MYVPLFPVMNPRAEDDIWCRVSWFQAARGPIEIFKVDSIRGWHSPFSILMWPDARCCYDLHYKRLYKSTFETIFR
jgi:hypothetical protein